VGAAINVGDVYANLVRDLPAGIYSLPGFEHGLNNARRVEAVRRTAEQGERQKVTSMKGTDPLCFEYQKILVQCDAQ
jgi:hypothetical protein